jgi:tetratricopeptide (TPR) repeat protein
MIKPMQILILALLFVCAPVAAKGTTAPPPETKAAAIANLNPDTAKIAALEKAVAEARYQKDIAEIKADLLQSQTSWFEILTSAMIGLFGVFITVVLIYFAFRFDRDARRQLDEGLKESKAQSNAVVAQLKTDSKANLDAAKAILGDIKKHRDTAKSLLADIAPGTAPTDPKTIKDIAALATDAEQKPGSQRTLDDYRALVIDASVNQEWLKMESTASVMAYLSEDERNDEATAFALFSKAYALGELNRHDAAIATYDDLISRFGTSAAPALQEQVAKALFNKAYVLGEWNRPEEAIKAYDDLIARFGKSETAATQEVVAKALYNKGNALGRLNRAEEAINAYEKLIALFGKSDNPALLVLVAKARFNKACTHSQRKDVQACVDALELWAERRGGMDCEAIRNEAEFDAVRDDETFKAFLTRHGCAGKGEMTSA